MAGLELAWLGPWRPQSGVDRFPRDRDGHSTNGRRGGRESIKEYGALATAIAPWPLVNATEKSELYVHSPKLRWGMTVNRLVGGASG
jgi:hypothetical protein